MTSWIWMKDVKVAVADPAVTICLEDDRPVVNDMIKEHGDKIGKIREALLDHPLYDDTKHDDLWILRFWLSHKKIHKSIEAAKYTLEFRKKYSLDERDIRMIAPHQVESGVLRDVRNNMKIDGMMFTHPHPQRGVICFLKLASMNQHGAVEKFNEDQWLEITMYCSEWTHQWLDYVTRTTGRFTKSIRLIDLKGFTMSDLNRECVRRDGKVMAIMEDCYPQLLESLFVCHPPTFVNVLWKICRFLLPKRVTSKFDIITPKDKISDRKKLLRHISEEDLPEFYGGKNPISPHDWKNTS